MNNTLTANDLKTKGISTVDAIAKNGLETFITVRGEQKYVIVTTAEFNRLRECELSAARKRKRSKSWQIQKRICTSTPKKNKKCLNWSTPTPTKNERSGF
jgi:hypothetical protein